MPDFDLPDFLFDLFLLIFDCLLELLLLEDVEGLQLAKLLIEIPPPLLLVGPLLLIPLPHGLAFHLHLVPLLPPLVLLKLFLGLPLAFLPLLSDLF